MLITILVLGVLGVCAIGGVYALGATAVGRNNKKQNQVVPGVDSNAPANWAGAHSLEAKLHRRIRDAVAGLHSIAGDDPSMATTIATVDKDALDLDNQLVAATMLAPRFKETAMVELEGAVAQLEEITSHAVSRSARTSERSVGEQLDDLAIRLESMRLARAEVDDADRRGQAT